MRPLASGSARCIDAGAPRRIALARSDHQHVVVGEHARASAAVSRVAVDDDAARLTRRRDRAHGELRIVVMHGADAGEDRARARAPAVAVGTRGLAGDPFRFARLRARCGRRGSPPPSSAPRGGRASSARRSRCSARAPRRRGDRCRRRCRRRAAARRRSPPPDSDPPSPRRRARSRRRSPRPRTAACVRCDCRARGSRTSSRRADRARGPRRRRAHSTSACGAPARSCQPSPTTTAARDDHAADARIRRRRVEAALGEGERARHVRAVGVGERGHEPCLRARFAGASTSFSASLKSETSWKLRYTEAKRM